MTDVVIVGSGALARSISYSLAMVKLDCAQVAVVSRSAASTEELSGIARTRARLVGSKLRFVARAIDLESQPAIEALVAELRPCIVVCCASYHSPWEGTTRPSAWTDLVQHAGFGITLPLQAVIARRFGYAIAERSRQTVLVNACFPDAVNPLLHALGLDVLCGLGNVAVLAAVLQTALDLPSGGVQVLAHHVHLHSDQRAGEHEVRAWVDGRPLADVEQRLTGVRKAARCELVHIAGCSAALVIKAMLAGEELRVSLPGPTGLPGGYPVRLQGRAISLDLPDSVSAEAAVEWNNQVGEDDGVLIRPGGEVVFSERAQRALRPYLPAIANGFHSGHVDEVCRQMLILRENLRRY